MERRTRRTIAAFTVLGAVLLAIPACSRDKGPDPAAVSSTTTAPPTTATTARPLTPEEEVEAAYLKGFRLLALAAMENPPPMQPLESALTEATLKQAKAALADLERNGQFVRYPANTPPIPTVSEIVLEGTDSATLTACLIDTGVLTDRATGTVINDLVVSKQSVAHLKMSNGVWKVTADERSRRWEDELGCDR